MKILLVTGQLAKNSVKNYASEGGVDFGVIDLPVPVAALLTPKYIIRELMKRKQSEFDLILVPGLIPGNTKEIEEELKIKTVKGPRYAADLPFVLNMLGTIELSKSVPADDVLIEKLRKKAMDELQVFNNKRHELLKKPNVIPINNIPTGVGFPIRIMAEIVDAPLLTDEQIIQKAKRYCESGADIIDIGMVSGESNPEGAGRIISLVKSKVTPVISIDTIDPCEAEEGVKAGADLILSADGGNLEEIASFASKIPTVVIPTNHKEKLYPKDPLERILLLEQNIKKAREMGMEKIFADLILDPVISPGILKSIAAFYEFRKRNPRVPLLVGIGNITELMDADSIGANALLTGISYELGASIILTTEVSYKTQGCVKELSFATRMMSVSYTHLTLPTILLV